MLLQIQVNSNALTGWEVGGFGPVDCTGWPEEVQPLSGVEIRALQT